MSKVRVDLQGCSMQVGDRFYYYEENEKYDSVEDDELEKIHWFRNSKKYFVSTDSDDDGRDKVTAEEIEEFNMSGEEVMPARVRIKDPDKLRKLNRKFKKALPKALAKREEAEKREEEEEEAEQREIDKEVEAMEREREHRAHKSSKGEDTESRSSSDTTGDVTRTKWGTRITSNDKKHYFGIGVWKSTKYEECSTVRLSVAGRTYMYTLDKTQMKALRREISRGVPT